MLGREVLVCLVILGAGIHMVPAVVYLSGNGNPAWNSDCATDQCEEVDQPCGLPVSTVNLLTDCAVYLVSGEYNSAYLNFVGTQSVTISTDSSSEIKNLSMVFSVDQVSIYSGTWINSNIFSLGGAKLLVSGAVLSETPISLLSAVNEMQIVGCNLTSDSSSLITTSQGSGLVGFEHVYFSSSSLMCQRCKTLFDFETAQITNFNLVLSDFKATKGSVLKVENVTNVQVYGTYIIVNNAFLEVGKEINQISVTHDSTIISPNVSSIFMTKAPTILECTDTILQNFFIGDLRDLVLFQWQNVHAVDISVRFPSSPTYFSDSKFIRTVEYHPSGYPFFWIEAFQTQFSNISFIDDFTGDLLLHQPVTPAFLLDNGVFNSGSSLTATSLTIRGNVMASGNLTIHRALYGDWTDSTPTLQSSVGVLDSYWTFRSLIVSAVVQFENVTLSYVVTDPSGISTPCASHGSLLGLPLKMSVLWDPEAISNPPIVGSNDNLYPIGFFTRTISAYSTEVDATIPSSYLIGALEVETIPDSGQGDRLSFWFSDVLSYEIFPNSGALAPVVTEPCKCPLPSPGDLFKCVFGNWQFTGSFETEIIILPSDVQVIVTGNLTVGTIQYNGLGTTVNVNGCANVTKGITLILNPDEITPGTTQQLIQQNGANCSLSLQNIALSVISLDPSDCKQVTVTTSSDSTPSSLTVLFGLDESSCSPKKKDNNTRWIILGSVLGGVLIIMVVLILVFTLNPAAKNCIRPYSGRKATH